MMKVLIYNFLGRANDFSDLLPNERFATMAGVIKDTGHDVQVWDRANLRDLLTYSKDFFQEVERLEFYDKDVSDEYKVRQEEELSKILSEGFDLIFLNLWRGPGFKFSVELGEKIKEKDPEVRIFAIGQGADRLRDLLLKVAPYLDGVMYGLNYAGVKGLCQFRPIEELPNVIYKKGEEICHTYQDSTVGFEDLPLPIYDADVYMGMEGKFPIFPISLSNEACPFACPFCMRPASYGTNVVKKPLEKVLRELRFLVDNYGAKMFRITDSTPPYQALTEFSKAILDSDLSGKGLLFSGFSRLDVSGGDDFEILSKAGIKALFFGIETLDENNQKRIRKVYPFDIIKKRLQESWEAGIFNIGSFIFPLPGETKESMENTLLRMKEIAPYLGSVLIQPAGVYPETDWYWHPEEYGIKIFSNYDLEAPVYPVKYILPMRYWKPFPFTYDLMGKPAEDVSFQDIVQVFEDFCARVVKEIGLPIGIQDYDYVASTYLKRNHAEFTKLLISMFVNADYEGLLKLLQEVRS